MIYNPFNEEIKAFASFLVECGKIQEVRVVVWILFCVSVVACIRSLRNK